MKNPFAIRPIEDLRPIRDELQNLVGRLDRVAAVLEQLATRTDTALSTLPEAVVLRALAEVRSASAAATAAAWATVKRHIIEHVLKWVWRIALGAAGTQLLMHTGPIVDLAKGIFE